MTTALVSPFFDVLCKNNKIMNYTNNNNIINPTTTNVSLLDRKAVGTPSLVNFQRRHSVTVPNSKFNQNLLNSLKMEPSTTLGNKENKFRDRSFSENGERLLKSSGQINSSRYKTELCRPYEENGSCKYGDKCQFAHGVNELRNLTRHPKYKTELCRTFHTIGFCPYGPRCHFIHNAEERRMVAGRDQAQITLPSMKVERPRLHHSVSFAGFPSNSSGFAEISAPTTPPPTMLSGTEDLVSSPSLLDCANNPFASYSQDIARLCIQLQGAVINANYPYRTSSGAVQSSDGGLSDQDCYSSSPGSSDSESSPTDPNRRLPIFNKIISFSDHKEMTNSTSRS
ncbi:mRNA decay activator protein ZFP36L1 [Protopterus annectens]|uniref:mRNA decay activator protein ZFP36L1 n=1 Tax=Protopterus annectens TaxID=7888 RepID=UPI001CFBA113|nr:mRNA decay activator protein ZFP36L1 [Protopterus annectens]